MGLGCLVACDEARRLQGAGTADHADDLTEACHFAVLDGMADEIAFGRLAACHGQQQRQRWLALPQVVADVLAQFMRLAVVVKQIIDELKRRTERSAVTGAGLLVLFSLAVNTMITVAGAYFQSWVPLPEALLQTANVIMSYALVATMFARYRIHWR